MPDKIDFNAILKNLSEDEMRQLNKATQEKINAIDETTQKQARSRVRHDIKTLYVKSNSCNFLIDDYNELLSESKQNASSSIPPWKA